MASCSGYGYGDASGFGSGDGLGCGDGNGSEGYGNGSGTSFRNDHCDGSGDGSGYGSGAAYGYGDGFGCGYGNGNSDIKEYCGHRVWMLDYVPTLVYSVHGCYAHGAILRNDLTLLPCYIARVGNSLGHGATLRVACQDATVKNQRKRSGEERVSSFVAAHPDPDAEYDGQDLYDWHHILTGSCKAGRDAWCYDHGLDPDRDRMTVREFLRLTADAYGGEVIRAVAARYEIAL